MLDLAALTRAVNDDAALRRRRRLQPVGGQGDKLFPPTYPGEGTNAPPRHVFEARRIDDAEVVCVLLDSVQSQANRLEEALLEAAKAGAIRLPRLVVDFPSSGLNSVPAISSLDAPHRVFDAILRDSELGGVAFGKSKLGLRLKQARPHDATALLECSPNSLLFGVWNSTGDGGGLGAKFARAIVSEIIAVNVPAEVIVNQRDGSVDWKNKGRRTGSRIDPVGTSKDIPIYHLKSDPEDWTPFADEAEGGPSKPKPFSRKNKSGKAGTAAMINHGNIPPSQQDLGISCAYAEQTAVITFAGLRRLRFGGAPERDATARTYLAALGLVALAELDARGYALRSRCDLVCDGSAPLELVHPDGSTDALALDVPAARALHEAAFDAAVAAGFALDPNPLELKPSAKLVHLVQESQRKALEGEGGDADPE